MSRLIPDRGRRNAKCLAGDFRGSSQDSRGGTAHFYCGSSSRRPSEGSGTLTLPQPFSPPCPWRYNRAAGSNMCALCLYVYVWDSSLKAKQMLLLSWVSARTAHKCVIVSLSLMRRNRTWMLLQHACMDPVSTRPICRHRHLVKIIQSSVRNDSQRQVSWGVLEKGKQS